MIFQIARRVVAGFIRILVEEVCSRTEASTSGRQMSGAEVALAELMPPGLNRSKHELGSSV